jgi:hypothetical protein
MESVFNPTLYNKDIGIVTKDQERRYNTLDDKDKKKVITLVKDNVTIEQALRQVRKVK